MGKVDHMQEQLDNVSKEMEILRKKQKEMLGSNFPKLMPDTRKLKGHQVEKILKIPHLSISYSNSRKPKTKRKSWKKLVERECFAYRETRIRITSASLQKSSSKKRFE